MYICNYKLWHKFPYRKWREFCLKMAEYPVKFKPGIPALLVDFSKCIYISYTVSPFSIFRLCHKFKFAISLYLCNLMV